MSDQFFDAREPKDRGGFLAAYNVETARAGVQRVPQVSVPSAVPAKLPQEASVDVPAPTAAEKDKPARVVMRGPIGQDVGDRNIAHIVSGGMGS